jgi:hypothetical protein
MARLAASAMALALAGVLALGLSSCGGSDAKLLAGTTAQEIRENLDAVQSLAEEGECVGASDEALKVSEQVEAVEGIDPKLKQALEEGAAQLNRVVDTCRESEEETVEETTPSAAESAEKEKQEQAGEKAQEKTEKEEEKETKEQEKEEEKEGAEEEAQGPALPPQANGKGKGHDEAAPPPAEEGGQPSGGIGPAGEAGGGD